MTPPTNETRRDRTAADMAVHALHVVLALVKAGAPTVEVIASIAGSITATEALLHARILAAEEVHPDDLVAEYVARARQGGLS